VKIVNTSSEPFEFMFNAASYGPYKAGEIIDLPDEVALHGIKRSTMLDEEGAYIGQKLEPLDSIKIDPDRLQKIITYDCPMSDSDQCNAKGFRTLDDLRVHMEQAHGWMVAKKEDPLLAPAAPTPAKQSSGNTKTAAA
jgi:hypothetical protein